MAMTLLHGRFPSTCCSRAQTTIVLSRPNGFVTQNCSCCGKPRSVRPTDLPERYCLRCEVRLDVGYKWNNYVYRCPACGDESEVAKLVPKWNEMFDYQGYGLDSDGAMLART